MWEMSNVGHFFMWELSHVGPDSFMTQWCVNESSECDSFMWEMSHVGYDSSDDSVISE